MHCNVLWIRGEIVENSLRVLEGLTALKIGYPEEVAYRMGFIGVPQLEDLVERLKPCAHRDYLQMLVCENTEKT